MKDVSQAKKRETKTEDSVIQNNVYLPHTSLFLVHTAMSHTQKGMRISEKILEAK